MDKERTARAVAKLSSESGSDKQPKAFDDPDNDVDDDNDVFEENGFSDLSDPEDFDVENILDINSEKVAADNLLEKLTRLNKSSSDSGNVPDEDLQPKCVTVEKEQQQQQNPLGMELEITENVYAEASANSSTFQSNKSSPSTSSYETVANDFIEPFSEPTIPEEILAIDDVDELPIKSAHHAVIITNASIDVVNMNGECDENIDNLLNNEQLTPLQEETLETLQEPKSACVSPASSNGGVYSVSFFF